MNKTIILESVFAGNKSWAPLATLVYEYSLEHYTAYHVCVFDYDREKDDLNIQAYIKLIEEEGGDTRFKDDILLYFQDQKFVSSSAYWIERPNCTVLNHRCKAEYLASFPDWPKWLTIPEEEEEKEPTRSVMARYFRVNLAQQHVYAPAWNDILFFDAPISLRVTVGQLGQISVEKTNFPYYHTMNYHKLIPVPSSLVQCFAQLHAIDEQRASIIRTLFD